MKMADVHDEATHDCVGAVAKAVVLPSANEAVPEHISQAQILIKMQSSYSFDGRFTIAPEKRRTNGRGLIDSSDAKFYELLAKSGRRNPLFPSGVEHHFWINNGNTDPFYTGHKSQ